MSEMNSSANNLMKDWNKGKKLDAGLVSAIVMFFRTLRKDISIWMVYIVLFGVLLGVVGTISPFFVQILDNAGIVMSFFALCLTAAMGLWVWKEREEVRQYFLSTPPDLDKGDFTEIDPKNIKAMIIPVSRKEQPEWILRHLKPQRVMFLYTPRSHSDARELYEKYSDEVHLINEKIDIDITEVPKHIDPRGKNKSKLGLIVNAFDPEEVYNEVLVMLKQLISDGCSKDNIFVDTTGGTVPMSIGAFMAAEEVGVSTVYVVATKPNGKIEEPMDQYQGRAIYLVKHEQHID